MIIPVYAKFKSPMNRYILYLSLFIALLVSQCVHLYAQKLDSVHFFIEQYEYQKAIDIIDSIADYDEDPEILNLKIASLKGLQKYREAIPYLEKLYLNDSVNVKRITELANAYQMLGNFVAARKFYHKALEINPDNYYLVQQLADSYYQADNFSLAKQYYLTAFRSDSAFHLSRQLARCYENLEMLDSAKYYYRIALSFVPDDYQSTYLLANLFKLSEEYDKGIALTNSYLPRDSTNIKMLRLNGFLYFLNKDYPISRARFERSIALNDTSTFVFKYLGYSYFHTSEFEQAKDYLEKAFLQDTLNADLCYALGLSCDYSVYKELGIYYLNKTIDLLIPAPSYLSQVYQDLAHVYTGNYKYNEALGAYLTAYELTPADTLLIFTIASHYDNWLKDKTTALIYYQKFMDTRPKNNKPLPKMPGVMVLSYYDYVERRMSEIREEIFWEEK